MTSSPGRNASDSMTTDKPAALERLQQKAEQHGWDTDTNYARGVYRDRCIESWLLRLRRGDVKLACTWEKTPSSGWAFRSALRQKPFGKLNSREVVAEVTS